MVLLCVCDFPRHCTLEINLDLGTNPVYGLSLAAVAQGASAHIADLEFHIVAEEIIVQPSVIFVQRVGRQARRRRADTVRGLDAAGVTVEIAVAGDKFEVLRDFVGWLDLKSPRRRVLEFPAVRPDGDLVVSGTGKQQFGFQRKISRLQCAIERADNERLSL